MVWFGNFIWWVGTIVQLFLIFHCDCKDHPRDNLGQVINLEELQPIRVQLFEEKDYVSMSNGIVNVTLSIPAGHVTKVAYNGIDNLLATQNEEYDRGYWDMSHYTTEKPTKLMLSGTSYKVITDNEEQIEISFVRTWNATRTGKDDAPLSVDKRFVLLRGSPGFYTYAIFKRLKGWPSINIAEARVVFKLQDDMFNYMAMSDERQRMMPTLKERLNGNHLDTPEAVQLKNTSNPNFQGEVDDKYLYSCDNKDNKVHGWVSMGKSNKSIGFWMITPSNEFRTGGPFKQDLTCSTGPILLSMFVSRHYAGNDLTIKFKDGEPWTKVFGPNFVYLNSIDLTNNYSVSLLWDDAKKMMLREVESWPYTFPLSNDFIHTNQRGSVTGQLLVQDWYINKEPLSAPNAYVGLAQVGSTGSWQRENKGYQFWTKTDSSGNFVIKNVIEGSYNLYASIPGIIGDYKYDSIVNITPGTQVELNGLVYKPPRNGATLWEIGYPDRTAGEFYVPDPSPQIKIHQFNATVEKFRQYGLWNYYTEKYPQSDLVFTIGSSNYATDWFFAHVTRKIRDNVYQATTWEIIFELTNVKTSTNYTLQVAIASATRAVLQVRFNDPKSITPHFTTTNFGQDNAVARYGIHGLYWLYSISVSSDKLISGNNTIYLTQSNANGPFREIMYDYIRFEGPV